MSFRDRREALRAAGRRGSKRAELEMLGVPAAWDLTEETLDVMLTTEKKRRSEVYEEFIRTGSIRTFPALGVQIVPAGGEKVYTIGPHDQWKKTNGSRLLGSLAGAQATVTDGSQAWSPGRAMFLPVALAGLATTAKANAAVVFPDGTVHTRALNGGSEIREAQVQVVQFNALAASNQPAYGAASGPAGGLAQDPAGIAAELERLTTLRASGALDEEEFRAAKARIIHGG